MATEKRMIDANALLGRLADSSESWAKNLQAIRNWWPHAVGIKDNIVRVIEDMPTVDAVEVIRCKECKHYKPQEISVHWEHKKPYCMRGTAVKVSEDDFCSYGERRTDNG